MPGGVFTPCKGMMLVNGTAPFVYDGSLNSAVNGGIQKTVYPVVPFSNYNPPTAEIVVGFSDSVWDISTQKVIHPNQDSTTRFFKLGKLVTTSRWITSSNQTICLSRL
jgi:hypothetical protein